MKTNTKLKYLPIAAFAAVAVALAGCGGGGSSPVTSAPADTPTIAVADLGADGTIEAGTYQLTGTPEELLALAAAIAGIDEPPEGGYAPGETVTIPGFADLTCTGDVNCTVMVAEDGTVMTTGTIMTAALGEGPGTEPMPTTQVALTAAEEAVAAAKEALEALEALEGDEAATPAQIATAEAAVLTAEEALADAQTAHDDYEATTPEAIAAAAVEAQERAEGIAAAILAAETAGFVINSFNPAIVAATNDGSGAKVTVTAAETTRKYAKQDTGPSAIDGWDGSRWSRAATRATEHLTVYTDIGAPTPMAFETANVQKLAGATGVTVAAGGVVDLVNTRALLANAKATSLTLPDEGATTMYPGTATGGLTFEGTFGGATGDFSCTDGATCMVTLNDKGTVTVIAGTWTFDADVDAMVHIADTEYLNFGWWVKAPDAADGKYTFQTFAGASTLLTPTDVSDAMTGTATYTGAAAGVYVLKDVSGGLVTGASNGDFTASAALTADFLDEDPGVINGSITDFVNGAGDSMDGWSVTLNNAALAGTDATSFSGTTLGKIGDGSGPGNWTGTFYGADDEGLPTDVAGRFDAHLPGAHIAGAYGASQ